MKGIHASDKTSVKRIFTYMSLTTFKIKHHFTKSEGSCANQ